MTWRTTITPSTSWMRQRGYYFLNREYDHLHQLKTDPEGHRTPLHRQSAFGCCVDFRERAWKKVGLQESRVDVKITRGG
nr:hypothetical protein CFP56_70792 [Quercus suber]